MLFDVKDASQLAATRRIKAWAEGLAAIEHGEAVMVNELRCTEPGCPPIETVIAFLLAGAPPVQVKIHKPATEVTEEDVRTAIDKCRVQLTE
jgi:hypothetical protein